MKKLPELLNITFFFFLLIGIYYLITYKFIIGVTLYLALYTYSFVYILFKKEDKNNDNKHTKNTI